MPKTDPRDKELKNKLEELFKPWEKKLKEKFDEELKKSGKKFEFITDGALPGYFKHELKILLIAREMHTTEDLKDNPEERNIVEFVKAFLSGQFGKDSARSSEAYAVYTITAGKKKNILPCWRLAAHIAYGLLQLQGLKPEIWGQASSIKDIQKSYNKNEFSFAIIEVSKYNNIVKSKNAPGISPVFEQCAYESVGFIRKEIDLLDPHLIITWNLRGAFKKDRDGKEEDEKGNKNNGDCFLKELTGSSSFEEPSKNVRVWKYKPSNGGEIMLLDTWHFSLPRNNIECFYRPISEAVDVQNLIAKKKAQDEKKL